MGTENEESCSQRDNAECERYVRVHRSFNRIWKERDIAMHTINRLAHNVLLSAARQTMCGT